LFGFLAASGKSVKCPNCGNSGFTDKNAKSCTCPKCKTKIELK
jgi:predicted Zn-ribbon and HTH transcriptional regulator